jgi:hypothetical protein
MHSHKTILLATLGFCLKALAQTPMHVDCLPAGGVGSLSAG